MKLGKAFSDSVIIEQKSYLRKTKDPGDSWWAGYGRALMFFTFLSVAFFLLLWRLFDLTVVQGHRFRVLADGNRTRELIRHAPRGNLLDRAGTPLTKNIPQYRLLKPCEGQGEKECVMRITQGEGERLSKEGLPGGNFLEVDYLREYVFPQSTSHVLGYVGELSEKELQDEYYTLRLYHRGDKIGRMGAEAVYEEQLRGRDGKELVEVDASGKILRVLGRQEELPGQDVTLSLDAGVSEVVAQAFPPGQKGAVVVSKPSTGEILGLYSSPSFSSNAFSLGMSQQEYTELLNNSDRPMFNRAIGGVYPPGSTFKIVTSLAGVEEGVVKPGTTVEDIGVLKIGPFSFPNWYFLQYGKTEGIVDLPKALQRSNDIFFYKVGEWLGITKIAAWAHKVGLGKPLGIELSGEASGLVPDPTWKKSWFDTAADRQARNDEWYVGDTYHVAIGQGYLLTTPLQVNAWTNVIANGGKLCRPTIHKQGTGFRGSAFAKASADKQGIECEDLGIKKETIEVIMEGMHRACESGGTGWPLFNFSVIPAKAGISDRIPGQVGDDKPATPSAVQRIYVPVACKTGTAEFGDSKNRTHAWFTVVAPLPKDVALQVGNLQNTIGDTITGEPEISITVLVEGAGEGSYEAAPIAKKILEAWFSR